MVYLIYNELVSLLKVQSVVLAGAPFVGVIFYLLLLRTTYEKIFHRANYFNSKRKRKLKKTVHTSSGFISKENYNL